MENAGTIFVQTSLDCNDMFSDCIFIRTSSYPLSRLLRVVFDHSDFYRNQQIRLWFLFLLESNKTFFSFILSCCCQLFPRSWEGNFKILLLVHQELCFLAQNRFQIPTFSQKTITPELSRYEVSQDPHLMELKWNTNVFILNQDKKVTWHATKSF